LAIDELVAVIAIDCSVAVVTVKVIEFDVTPLKLAVITDVPVLTAVTRPVALIVATPGVAEFHTAVEVRFCVVESLYVPVAVNWSVRPLAIEELGAVIAIDCSVAVVTVKVIEFEVTPFKLAVITDAPVLTAVASPVAPIVATPGVAEFHTAVLVRFCVVESL
jgi:hypothetical protein